MSHFYAELLRQQQADIPVALAAAQRAMISQIPAVASFNSARGGGIGGGHRPSSTWHPLGWAGFSVFVSESAT